MRYKILVCDDDEDILELIKETLTKYEMSIVTATEGKSCIEKVKEIDPDLIILDLGLPDMSGMDVCKILKQDKSLSHIPIIFITGKDKKSADVVKGLNIGASDYILKPFKIDVLLARINTCLHSITERKKAEDALREREMKLKTLFNILPVGISILDAEQNIIYNNSVLEKILDLSSDDLFKEKHKILKYLRPDGTRMPAKEYPIVRAGIEHQAVHNVVTGIVKEDGEVLWVNVDAFPVAFSDWRVIVVTTDITDCKKMDGVLKESEKKLYENKLALEQKNQALKELLEEMERTKNKTKEDIAINVEEFIIPILKKIKLKGVTSKYVDVLCQHLNEITSSFGSKISQKSIRLSTREIEICNLIKGGLQSKEISELLNISYQTIEKHRKNIRKKLGIANKRVNLTSFLQKF